MGRLWIRCVASAAAETKLGPPSTAGKLPWIWPVPPSCMHPHCPPDLLGSACSRGRDLRPRAPRVQLCVSFTAVPHFSQAEDQRERHEGAALDPSLSLSPVPLEREQGSSHVPSLCFPKLRVERRGGGTSTCCTRGQVCSFSSTKRMLAYKQRKSSDSEQ